MWDSVEDTCSENVTFDYKKPYWIFFQTRPKSPQKKAKTEQISPNSATEVEPSLDNNSMTISPKKPSGSLVTMEKVLRPVLEDREKTFDSSVSVEFKLEGIC